MIERDIKKLNNLRDPSKIKIESIQIKQKDSHGFHGYFLRVIGLKNVLSIICDMKKKY